MDYEKLFAVLNDELRARDLSLTVVCLGGFVMQYYGLKATMDVDAFYDTNAEIEDCIRRTGEKFGLNGQGKLWLNNDVKEIASKPLEEKCDILYSFSNLIVKAVSLNAILLMKLEAQRVKDIEDSGTIIKALKLQSPVQLLKEVDGFDGSSDPAVVIEAFENAYGEEWMREYAKSHKDELKKLLRGY